jgi:hypothetical protein
MESLNTVKFVCLSLYFFTALFHYASADEAKVDSAESVTDLKSVNINVVSDKPKIEDQYSTESDSSHREKKNHSLLNFMDSSHDYLSSNVESIARNLDEYFSSDKVLYATSGTIVRLREDVISTEGAGVKIKGDIRLKLQLPQTQKKLRLVFQSGENESYFKKLGPNTNTSSVAIEKEENYLAEVQGLIGEKFGWKFNPSIGAYLGRTVDTYFKFNFNKQYVSDKWSLNWDETPYWVASIGWALDNYFELNRKIGDDDIFRSATYAGWRKDIDYFELSQVFFLNYQLNKKMAVSYYTGVYGISEPKIHTTQYLVGLTYRQNIYKDYLFMEIKPQITYQEINRFAAEHSLALRFEMLFKK